jgi:PAS domain-containing protein
MGQKEIEIILARQLASYLAIPIFIVDPVGTLIFFNEPAEMIVGLRFEETGEMPVEAWSDLIVPSSESGEQLQAEARPLLIALAEQRPAHRPVTIRRIDGMPRHLEVTAIPLIGMADRFLGAIAFFWEAEN